MEVVCVKERDVRKDYFERLNSLKKRLRGEFVWLESRDLCEVMSKLGHYHYNKKKIILLGEYRTLYDFLIKNGFNPFTVYRWLLLERVPDNIKAQLKQRKISQKKALIKAFKQRRETVESIGVSVRELGLALVRGM